MGRKQTLGDFAASRTIGIRLAAAQVRRQRVQRRQDIGSSRQWGFNASRPCADQIALTMQRNGPVTREGREHVAVTKILAPGFHLLGR